MLYVHPFLEEMNKSRRPVAICARALARAGFEVSMFDLHGCGDSDGELRDAAWSMWLAEVRHAIDAIRARTALPLWVWGLRAGALLATAAANASGHSPHLLYWQPVASGKQHLRQFLRLGSAGDLVRAQPSGQEPRTRTQDALEQGRSVEIAGYELSPALAEGLANARLSVDAGYPGRICWFDIVAPNAPAMSPASARVIEAWRAAGIDVRADTVSGDAFWQTQEIVENPELVQRTVQALIASEGA